jgi:hypothetical protein
MQACIVLSNSIRSLFFGIETEQTTEYKGDDHGQSFNSGRFVDRTLSIFPYSMRSPSKLSYLSATNFVFGRPVSFRRKRSLGSLQAPIIDFVAEAQSGRCRSEDLIHSQACGR